MAFDPGAFDTGAFDSAGPGDVATRSTLIVRAFKDIAARFTLSARAYKDVGLRAALRAFAYKDVAVRFTLQAHITAYKDVAARTRLAVRGYKDIAARARLIARSYLTVAVRVTIRVRGFKDAGLRSRIIARAYKHIALRSYLRARSYKDTKARFRLVWIPWTPTHDYPALADVLSFTNDSSPVIVSRMRSKRSKQSVSGQMQHFDNLDYPRVYFGEWREESWDVVYRVVPGTDQDQFANLKTLILSGQVLKYVNQHGDVLVVTVTTAGQDFFTIIPTKPQDITLTLTRVEGALP